MPIVDLAAPPIDRLSGRPEGFAVTPGLDEIAHGSDTPETFWIAPEGQPDVMGAAVRQGNIIGSALSQQDAEITHEREPGFNPWDAIKGTKYEPHWQSFTDIRNTKAADARKRQIDMEDEDRKTIDAAPWYMRLPAQLLAGAADPTMFFPGAAFYRTTKGAISIGRTALSVAGAAGGAVTLQEAGLHATQQTRTLTESGENIGASVFLGGLLGAGGAKLLSRAEWNAAVDGIRRDVGNTMRAEPHVTAPTGLPHVDAILSEPSVAEAIASPKINRTQDVPYTAGPDKTGAGLNIDRHFPESITVEGKTFDPAKPFAVHEFSERAAMERLIAGGMDEATAYKVAHWEVAEKAEGEWYRANGIDQAKAEAAYQPFIDQIEHEKLAKGEGDVPENLFKKPYPHDNVNAAAHEGVAVPKPTEAEIARARSILGAGGTVEGMGSRPAVSVGAAAMEPVSLESNTIAGRAARTSAAVTRQLNPFMRVLQNPSAVARDVIQRLGEFTGYTEGNFAGVASPRSAETRIKRWQGGLTAAIHEGDRIFADYVKGGGTLKADEFRAAVGKAMRREDQADSPAVAAAAKSWREKVVEPLKDEAVKVGLLPEDVEPDFAPSYFSRMWNRQRIIGEEGRFKGITSEFMQNHITREWEKATAGFNARKAALEQELSDINLTPAERTTKLGEVETALAAHEEGGEAYLGLSEKADQVSDAAAAMRRAKQAGDDKAYEAAKTQRDALVEAGGKELKEFTGTRTALRARRRNIDLGAAGLAERSQHIMETLADIEEANQRHLARLVKKGQKLERELGKLDPEMLAERISGMKDAFAELGRRSDAAADRTAKALETIRAKTEKTVTAEGEAAQVAGANAIHGNPEEAAVNRNLSKQARQRATEAQERADAATASRLEKEEKAQRARGKRMTEIAERLEVAEGFDRDGAEAELRAAVQKAVAETSETSLGRGERAQRLQERLAALDPQRIKDRAATIERMKAELERAYYDRWEIKNLGKDVDPAAAMMGGARPDFSDQAKLIAEHIYNRFTGRTDAGVRPEFVKIDTRGPMKDRTFNIPDLYVSGVHGAIEDFLEHDVQHVMSRYNRVMAADVEIQRQFGSLDLKDEMDAITANYARLRDGVTDPAQLKKLGKMEEWDKRDIMGVLDSIRGTRAVGQNERDWGHIVRSANHAQYLLKMGEVVLASLQDAARPVMVHGLLPYMRTIGQLATNLQAIKLSARDAQLMGNIAERVTPARLSAIADLGDPMARRGPVESILANLTDVASKWNGIRLWTDGMKSIAAVMTQNRILENAQNWGRLNAGERAYMHFLGIDQSMAERIAAQFEKHGEQLHGVAWGNTQAWGATDPVARDAFAAAMNKDVDSIIVIPSKADVPLLAHTPVGKTLLQFQSFTLASHQRVMLRGLQESPARFVSGAIAMTALGMLQTYLKAVSGNHLGNLKSIQDDPGWWAGEAIDRASFMPVFMQIANDFEKATQLNPIKSPLKIWDKGKTQSEKAQHENPLSLAGPTVGTAQDIYHLIGTGSTWSEGKAMTKAEKNAGVRLMPFNSYLGMKQFLQYVVNPPQH
jgi:hypothetical protein